jgi:hypothetical protein
LLVAGPDRALADYQLAIAAATESYRAWRVVRDLQTDLVCVEVLRGIEVGRQQDHVNRVIAEHGSY